MRYFKILSREISYEKSENSGHMTRVSGTLGQKFGYDKLDMLIFVQVYRTIDKIWDHH